MTYLVDMTFGYIVARLIELYSLIMIFWVISSWFPRMRQNAFVRSVGAICEPPLKLVRRVLPTAGGFDFSPIVVIVLLQILARALAQAPF